ncbi:putative exopolysaccharide biosynthesis protein [Planktothrix serta PCC 8927]|uniref:non-specific protein-tyrosine kinase n=1 Tax=Planktothrix serta PCC 8927 TaxID=671068 RepID=A0A7Z9BKA6_9CYAN|nr:polysaccharide biosynthesis tyrosine autokinase [Planktothrix serta]VXD15815.1 putative exopolysaccharide biosynthesis protein [Planktothrix serta PCC 8927]
MVDRESIDLDFSRYLLTLKQRGFIVVGIFLLFLGLAWYGTRFLKPTYEATGKLLFEVDRTSSLAGIGKELGELKALLSDQTPLSTQIEIMQSSPLLEKTINILKLTDSQGKLMEPDSLRSKLKIKILGGTDIVEISCSSKIAKETADVVNTLMGVYISITDQNNRRDASKARDFIVQQLPVVQKEVFRVEQALRDFKEENQVLNLEQEFSSAVEGLSELNRQITTLESQLNGINSLSKSLETQVGLDLEEAIALNTLSESPLMKSTLVELEKVESDLTNERKRFRDQNPRIIALIAKKEALTATLQQQIEQILGKNISLPRGLLSSQGNNNLLQEYVNTESKRLDLTQQLNSLYESRAAYQKRASILPKLEQQQQELERKVQVARVTYETLLKNLEEVQVAENKRIDNTRIIETAIVPEKGTSKKSQLLILGVMLGLVFATASVLLLDILDKSVRSTQEIKNLLDYKLIGIIPFIPKNRSFKFSRIRKNLFVPVMEAPNSLVSELYRMMQANLRLMTSDKNLKVIVVTSGVTQEGKSTICANLSASIAQLGYRVLLIDADMRQPFQHQIWRLVNTPGLSDILAEPLELSSVIRQGMERLDVLTAGVISPNPLRLLESQNMALLIQNISKQYDFVIIDTPSLIVAADALIVSQMAQGILLVSRPGVIDRETAITVKEILDRASQRVLGLVINGINKKELNQYFYHAKRYASHTSKKSNFFDHPYKKN